MGAQWEEKPWKCFRHVFGLGFGFWITNSHSIFRDHSWYCKGNYMGYQGLNPLWLDVCKSNAWTLPMTLSLQPNKIFDLLLLLGHILWCSELSTDCTQGSLLVACGCQRIEPKLTACKARALPTVLSISLPPSWILSFRFVFVFSLGPYQVVL